MWGNHSPSHNRKITRELFWIGFFHIWMGERRVGAWARSFPLPWSRCPCRSWRPSALSWTSKPNRCPAHREWRRSWAEACTSNRCRSRCRSHAHCFRIRMSWIRSIWSTWTCPSTFGVWATWFYPHSCFLGRPWGPAISSIVYRNGSNGGR